MAHACNPSYSGGRDQEDRGSKPTRANRVYLEKTYHKKQLMEWLKVKVLSSSPSTAKKKKKKKVSLCDQAQYQLIGRQRQEDQELKASLGKVRETVSKNKVKTKGLGVWPSAVALAQHAQVPGSITCIL
jgi:hypothetical protein